MYNELVPRARTWIDDVEALFCSLGISRASVPYVSARSGGITVDGRLDEPEWRVMAPGQDIARSVLNGRPEKADASFLSRYDKQNLYIGVRVGKSLGKPRFSLCLMDGFSVPLSSSGFWYAQADNDAIVASTRVVRGRQVAWACEWRMASAANGDAWEAKVSIPFANLERQSGPQAADRWRIRCAVFEGENREPVAEWGNGELTRVPVHGDILAFEASPTEE